MENRCVCCGEVIPEGRMICPNCEKQDLENNQGTKIETDSLSIGKGETEEKQE